MTMLAVQSLALRRGGREIFRGLDFALGAGEAVALTGPNGSGKSSLLRALAGFLPPAAGAITWAGQPIDEARPAIAYLGARDALKPVLTVAENLAFARALAGHPPDPRAIARALEAFDLAPLAARAARFLSQGQARRAALARLIAAPALLWLLDEPTIALDEAALGLLHRAIAAHLVAGGLIVAATHVPLPAARRTVRLS